MRTLVLVEFLEDVPAALRLAAKGETLVASTPEVMEAFDGAGQVFEPWTTHAQHERGDALASDSLLHVSTLADAVTPGEPGRVSVARCHAHALHTLFCCVGFRALALRELVERHEPAEVVAFQPVRNPADGLLFQPGESAMAAVIACAAATTPVWGAGVEWRLLTSQATRRTVRARIARSTGRSPWRAAVSEWAWAARAREALQRWGSLRSSPMPGARILVVGDNPEFRFLQGDDVPRFVHWPSRGRSPVRRRRGGPVPATCPVPDLPVDAATWSGLNCTGALSPRWHWLRTRGAAQVAEWWAEADGVLDAVAPDAVIHGEVGGQAWLRTVLETARLRHVPLAFLQWGGNYGYVRQPYLALTELTSDLAMTYTAGVASMLPEASGMGMRCPPRYVVGSPHLTSLASRACTWVAAASPQVVYAPCALTGSLRYGPSLCLDDTAFFGLEWCVVETLAAGLPGRVALKLHPRNRVAVDPLTRRLRRRGMHLPILNEPVEALLSKPRVWVIDGAATTLQQLLVARQPVVYVHTGGATMMPLAQKLLREAVEWVDGAEEDLPTRLLAAIQRASRGPRPAGVEFVRRFVTEGIAPQGFVRRVRAAVSF